MRRVLPVLLLAVLAVALVAGCSSPNQPGRYVPISRGDGYDGMVGMVLDTQTGRVWVYSKFGNEYIWIASTESIPDVPIGKEPPPPPPPPPAAPAYR